MSNKIDSRYKVLFLGDSQVGKTCLILKLTDDEFKSNNVSTVGTDVRYKKIEKNNKKIRLDLWDTAGQERFRNITQNCFRGSNAIIFVYDITNKKTFDNLENWMKTKEDNVDSKIPIFIVGNKCEISDRKEVDEEEAKKFAIEYNARFFKVSCADGEGVDKFSEALIDELLPQHDFENVSNVDDDFKRVDSFSLRVPTKKEEDKRKKKKCDC